MLGRAVGCVVILLALLPNAETVRSEDSVVTTDVVIIGGGVSGIRAGSVLHHDGMCYTLPYVGLYARTILQGGLL